MSGRPHIAIIDSNTLAVLGLRQILQNVMSIIDVEAFGSLDEMKAYGPDSFFHYFVTVNVVLENRLFFYGTSS